MDYSISNNIQNISKYGKNNKNITKYYDISELKDIILRSYWNKKIMQLSWYDIENLPKFSNSVFNLLHWIILSSNSTALYILRYLSRNIINIEDIDIRTERFKVCYCKKWLFKYIIGLFLFLPIIILSFLIYALFVSIIIFSGVATLSLI